MTILRLAKSFNTMNWLDLIRPDRNGTIKDIVGDIQIIISGTIKDIYEHF